MHFPDWQIAGMYVAQQKDNDLSQELSKNTVSRSTPKWPGR